MKILAILLVIGLAFMIGCVGEEPTLEFLAGECDTSVDAYNKSELGIQETTWLDDNTLFVRTYVSINCAEEIKNISDFEIKGDNLILEYTVIRQKFEEGSYLVADCICAHELNFTIKNIEKKEYNIELNYSFEDIIKCQEEFCPIPLVVVPNGYYEAYCENDECKTRIVCNSGFELVGEECQGQGV